MHTYFPKASMSRLVNRIITTSAVLPFTVIFYNVSVCWSTLLCLFDCKFIVLNDNCPRSKS